MIFVAGLVFTRSAIIEVTDVQGDLVVGAETTPIVIGEKRTLRLLERNLAISAAVHACGIFLRGRSELVRMDDHMLRLRRDGGYSVQETVGGAQGVFEFITESNFILAGIITCHVAGLCAFALRKAPAAAKKVTHIHRVFSRATPMTRAYKRGAP